MSSTNYERGGIIPRKTGRACVWSQRGGDGPPPVAYILVWFALMRWLSSLFVGAMRRGAAAAAAQGRTNTGRAPEHGGERARAQTEGRNGSAHSHTHQRTHFLGRETKTASETDIPEQKIARISTHLCTYVQPRTNNPFHRKATSCCSSSSSNTKHHSLSLSGRTVTPPLDSTSSPPVPPASGAFAA